MDIANNWTIVIGVATLVSGVLFWSNNAYLKPILESQTSIIERVRKDLERKLKNNKDVIKSKGEEGFVEDISNIVSMKYFIRESKSRFRGRMVPLSLGMILLSVIFVSLYDYYSQINALKGIMNFIIIYTAIILLVMIAIDFFKIRKNERLLSRYSEGENPNKIIE